MVQGSGVKVYDTFDRLRAGEVSRREKMALRGTDSESHTPSML